MASGISKYESVQYSSISSQSKGESLASSISSIRDQINQNLDSEVKKKVLDALQKIQNDSSLKGSLASLKKNFNQLNAALNIFPDYRSYLSKYQNTSDEDREEEYYKKAKKKLEAIDSKLG